jgi:hypothetical protein
MANDFCRFKREISKNNVSNNKLKVKLNNLLKFYTFVFIFNCFIDLNQFFD